MIRAFRFPLRPTQAQEATLTAWLAQCCELYNAALEQRREAWRKQRVSMTRYQQQKELTDLRGSDHEWAAVPVYVQRSALERLERAFRGFYGRVRRGDVPGFPRFRSRERYDSFSIQCHKFRIEGDRVHLPKLGAVHFHAYRELRGTVRELRVHRGPRGWSISITCDIGEAPAKAPVRSVVGVDVGLEAFATLSNGERIENPRHFRVGAEALAHRQRSLARMKPGSRSRQRAKRLVGRAHLRIANQRLDHARKLAAALFARFDLVCHEDLQIARMVHGHLAKSIHDAAWGQFLRCIALKAEEAGKHCIAVDPRGTSQACAACGTVVKKELAEREHRCDCGFVTHRDHNAAMNVLARGLRVGQLTEASEVRRGL